MSELLWLLVSVFGYISAYVVSLYALAVYIDPDEIEELFPNQSFNRRELFLKMAADPRLFGQIAAVYKSFALILLTAATFFLVDQNTEVLRAQHRIGFVAALFIIWLLYIVIVEYLPRRSSRATIGPRMLGAFWLIVLIYVVFSPLVNLYRRLLAKSTLTQKVTEEEKEEIVERAIETLADNAGIGEQLVQAEEKEMIGQIFRLDQTTVREIMVPRIDIVAIENSTPYGTVRELVRRDGHSRYPVFDTVIDKVVGLLYLKDLFNNMPQAGEEFTIAKYLRPADFVPETKVIGELLKEFKAKRHHIAIVVDEYGGVAGLITLEDILEQIVGDIQDEHDREEADLVEIGPREYRADGGLRIDNFLQRIGLSNEQAPDDTIGGLIYDLVGSVPKEGARIHWHNLEFEILRLRGQRILAVRVRVLTAPSTQ